MPERSSRRWEAMMRDADAAINMRRLEASLRGTPKDSAEESAVLRRLNVLNRYRRRLYRIAYQWSSG